MVRHKVEVLRVLARIADTGKRSACREHTATAIIGWVPSIKRNEVILRAQAEQTPDV